VAAPAATSSETLRNRGEAAAAALPALLVAAERVAQTVVQGVHGRRRVGQGDAFWQFRGYEFGDPVNAIDWRQSARSQRVYVRENEWEAAQTVWLWRDGSPSMRWRSRPSLPEKAERAAILLIALASLLVRAGERVALLAADRPPPGAGRATLTRLADRLAREDASVPSLPPAIPLPRHARAVLIGDFLSPLDEVDAAVRALAAAGVRGHLVQVVDPVEESLPFAGRVRFEGMEAEGSLLFSRVETIRDAYRDRMAAHMAGLADIARAAGWTHLVHHTDRAPETALLTLHEGLSVRSGPAASGR